MKYRIDDTEYEVVVVKKNNKNTYLRVKDDLKIYVTTSLFASKHYIKTLLDDAIFVSDEKVLDKWLKKRVKELFQERLDYNFDRYLEKIPYPKLKIRSMKTRWGVCNIRDNSVTLNEKLIEYSIDKLDYVIIHELSHFIHFNHSKSFWNQVSKYAPNYKQIRRELKD